MKSPFIYGKTVSNDAFTDRTQESEKLSNNLLQGINTIIISPRRWGKSSLVEKVVNTINGTQTDLKTVVIDLFSVSTEEEFLELFAKEVIKASSSKWQDWLKSGKDLFKQLVPKLSVGVDPSSDFSLSFDWEELKRHKDEILNLPEVIAQKKNIRFVVCLDEFQNLATFPDYEGLEKKMRAIWQRQKKVCYCLYGSKRHMMTEIFNNTSKPLDVSWIMSSLIKMFLFLLTFLGVPNLYSCIVFAAVNCLAPLLIAFNRFNWVPLIFSTSFWYNGELACINSFNASATSSILAFFSVFCQV